MDDVTLIHGDCLQVMPTLPAQSVAMVFADLPFGVLSCRWDSQINLSSFWKNVLQVSLPNTAFLFSATQPFTTTLINSKANFFRYDLVWMKNSGVGHLLAKKRPLRKHESILLFSQKQVTYNPQMTTGHRTLPRTCKTDYDKSYGAKIIKGRKDSTSVRYPVSVLPFASDSQRRRGWKNVAISYLHPTQKPVALLEYLIRTYTNPGDTVLDPVAGSGTTAIAAMRTGRKAICIEKDSTYFATMTKRVVEERARMHQSGLAL